MDLRYQIFAVFLLYIAVSTTRAQTVACNTTTLDECLTRYSNVSSRFQNFAIDGTNIEASCRSYNEALTCVDRSRMCQDIERNVTIQWLGFNGTHGPICTDVNERAEYIKHQRCLGNGTYTSLLRTNCSAFNSYMPPLQSSPIMSPDSACEQYTKALQCQQAVAEDACSRETGEYVRKFFMRFLDPQLKNITPTCTGKCNADMLDTCLKDFKPYADRYLAASLNSTELEAGCRLHPIAAQCVREKANCADDDTITQIRWLGNRETAAYICGEGRNVYTKNRECLSNVTYVAERNKCEKPVATGSLTLQQACQAVINQVTCIGNVTNINCGNEAGNFMSKIAPRFLAPTIRAKNPSCNIPGLSGVPALTTSLALILSLLLAAFV